MIIKVPFKIFGYWAITIWPFIFVWKEQRDNEGLIKHEKVHLKQQIKHLLIFFYLRYAIEYLYGRLRKKLSHHEAYLAISYEVEAREKSGF